jgi:FkbM family methyltransferase
MSERVFVCVGPNRGCAETLRLLQGHDRFFMFEPLPDAANWLRQQNAHLADIFHVVQAACGDGNYQSKMRVYNKHGVSSSLGTCTQQAREMYPDADLSQQDEIDVQVVNLCEFLEWAGVKQIQTLVTDAQGMDLAILKTMEPYLRRRAVQHVIHEVDGDGFRHYDGLPDNSLSGAVAYMEQFGCYRPSRLPDRNDFNFDLEWRLCDAAG